MFKKKYFKSSGFTIMELIVVIAIIGTLSTIVSVGVTQYIARGKDSAIKANVSQIYTYGITYAEKNGNYNSFCTDLKVADILQKIGDISPNYLGCWCDTVDCADVSNSWCVMAQMQEMATTTSSGEPTTQQLFYCADSSGSRGIDTCLGAICQTNYTINQ